MVGVGRLLLGHVREPGADLGADLPADRDLPGREDDVQLHVARDALGPLTRLVVDDRPGEQVGDQDDGLGRGLGHRSILSITALTASAAWLRASTRTRNRPTPVCSATRMPAPAQTEVQAWQFTTSSRTLLQASSPGRAPIASRTGSVIVSSTTSWVSRAV